MKLSLLATAASVIGASALVSAAPVEIIACDGFANADHIQVKKATKVSRSQWEIDVDVPEHTKVVVELRALSVPVAVEHGASVKFDSNIVPHNVDTDARVRTFDDRSGELTGCLRFDFFEDLSKNVTVLGSVRGIFTDEQARFYYEAWKKDMGVEFFALAEDAHRFSVFTENLRSIAMHNNDGTQKYKKGMNQFGHLTGDEFKAMISREYVPVNTTSTFKFTGSKEELASSVDWVKEGAVTPVKNQGQCGSCWTFSTTGALESARKIAGGPLVELSEQQIVSCDTGGNGCGGGSMAQAFEWVSENGGLCTESAYPYESSSGTAPSCAAGPSCTKENINPSSSTQVEQSEASFMAAVSKQPVSIAVEADQSAFQFFKSGVITGTCGTNLDHGILLVGYGTYDGTDYWKVKNSWADVWGIEGYGRIERGASQDGGECGILMGGVYPNLA